MKIFLSYGHDEYADVALRLKGDLEAEGFEVWIDKEQIKGTSAWEAAIEEGILTSDWLVLMMTRHSVRRPDGVCLDEVSYARFHGKNIAPIMVQEVGVPLCIARIQWIDMMNFLDPDRGVIDEDAYVTRRDELLDILRGAQELGVEGGHESLFERLNPLDNDVFSEHFTKGFFGRQALFRLYDEWLASGEKVLWLVGDAGIGKTAFIANLATVRGDVQAVHFCRFNDNERANPKRAIMSIAYYLSTQIPEYRYQLMELQDLGSLIEKSTERLFEYLIVEPLCRVSYDGDPVVIVIDALDEATVNGRNELADIIARQFEKTPGYVRLLVTSRREALLERKLSRLRPVDLADPRYNNREDVRGFFSRELGARLPAGRRGSYILDRLVEKSEGIFLYAKTIVDEIASGALTVEDIDSFPEGITGIYLDYFDRIFASQSALSYKGDVRPVMEVLCASCAPMSVETLCDILGTDEYDFEDVCELMCEMFPVRDGVMKPIHKSLVDWLIDKGRSGQYHVSVKRGNNRIADYYLDMTAAGGLDPYAVRYLCTHLLEAGRIDELVKILNDSSFFERRVDIMGLDSAVRRMLFEIEGLSERDVAAVNAVFRGKNFASIFAKYRKFFYNSGLYFRLKDCGFDHYLERPSGYESNDGQIGIAYYYYITESFGKAIVAVENIFSSERVLSPVEQAELHNLMALCYRKSVDFAQSKEHFMAAFEAVFEMDAFYDQSISLVNLGKIAYHELDWTSAIEWNRSAIGYLERELAAATDQDYRISLELFVAEYHRLSAECLIWNYDLDQVDEHLAQAEQIYARVQSRDRYFVRYLYTSEFRNVLAGEFEEAFESCDLLMRQATSSYDKSQILFYRGIAALGLGRDAECEKCAREAYVYARDIGAWLEMEEIVALASLIRGVDVRLEHSAYLETNTTMQNWVRHATSFIDSVVRKAR